MWQIQFQNSRQLLLLMARDLHSAARNHLLPEDDRLGNRSEDRFEQTGTREEEAIFREQNTIQMRCIPKKLHPDRKFSTHLVSFPQSALTRG